MAGCYGRSPEDRARELELFRYLDDQDAREARIQARVDALWDNLTDPAYAEKLDNDWEVTQNITGLLLSRIAMARQLCLCNAEFPLKALTEIIEPMLIYLAEREEDNNA